MSDENTPAYAGFCQGCGNMVSVVVDDPRWKKEVADFCREQVRDGLRLERVTVGRGRKELEFCTCKPRPEKARQEALAL